MPKFQKDGGGGGGGDSGPAASTCLRVRISRNGH
jgi:hypothetical protein